MPNHYYKLVGVRYKLGTNEEVMFHVMLKKYFIL